MRGMRVLGVIAGSWLLGMGGGLALLGEWQYALTWIATWPLVALFTVFVSPWAFMLLPIALVASAIHGIARARKSDAPLVLFARWPGIVLAANIVVMLSVRLFVIEAFKIPSSSMYPTLQIGDHIFADKLTPLWHSPERGEVVVYRYPCERSRDYIHRVVAIAGDTVEVRCSVLYVNGKAVPSELASADCTYDDYDESTARWFAKSCSRYHEQLDGRAWDVFHDAQRPLKDRMRAQGTVAAGDPRDFPMPGREPSCQSEYTEGEIHDQVKGKLVATKPGAAPCEPQLHYVVPPDHVFVMGDNRSNANDSRMWGALQVGNVKGRLLTIWWARDMARVGPAR